MSWFTRSSVPEITALDAKRLLDSNPDAVVLDVRTDEEFAEARIPGAVQAEWGSPAFQSTVAGLDREKTYVVHCHSGGRSAQAVRAIERLGFTKLFHLGGGIVEWAQAGLPLKR